MSNQSSRKLKRSYEIFKQTNHSDGDQSEEPQKEEKLKGKKKKKQSHKKSIKKKSKSMKKKKRNKKKSVDLKVEDRQSNKQTEQPLKLQKQANVDLHEDIKVEQTRRRHKKSKSKKKAKIKRQKSRQTSSSPQSKQIKNQQEKTKPAHQHSAYQEAEAQPEQISKQNKKRKPRQNNKLKKKRKNRQADKAEEIDVDNIKFEQNFNWENNNETHNKKLKCKKKQVLSLQDKKRIIYLFSLDAGDYRGMRKEMPHIPQRHIRGFLKTLFEFSLQMITNRARDSGRKIKDWEAYQKREIIRQLHRIRSSNRLLSEGNVEFRQLFLKVMQSYLQPQIEITSQNISFLYRKIEAFVRGFNHINFFRKNYYVAPDQEDERRKPIIQGGYIMQSKMKREQRKRHQEYQNLRRKIDPDQLVLQWTQIEEKELSKLYLTNITNYQNIIENLRTRFGDSDKWRDFQIVGKKLDHLIKLGLDRLQEITMKGYYDPLQLMEQEKNRMTKKQHQKKRRSDLIKKNGISSFQDLQSVVYNNKEIIKEPREVRQGGVIKNPSLLLKQVFAHVQSYKTKHRLVQLVVNRYPQQSEVQETIRTIKEFTEWANREQQKNGVTLIRSRPPVIDSQHHSQVLSAREERSVTHINKQQEQSAMIFQRGMKYLEQGQNQYTKKEFNDDSPVYCSGTADGEYKQVQTLSECKSKIVQVFQSDQSEYEGFINCKR